MPEPSLSGHARWRIRFGDARGFRISMMPDEIISALKANKGVPIGWDPREPNVRYLLLYSPLDEMSFVVVQDEPSGSVITLISTTDLNVRVIKVLTAEAYRAAREAMLGKPKEEGKTGEGKAQTHYFRLVAEGADASGWPIMTFDLKKIRRTPSRYDIDEVRSDAEFMRKLWGNVTCHFKKFPEATWVRILIRPEESGKWELLAESK